MDTNQKIMYNGLTRLGINPNEKPERKVMNGFKVTTIAKDAGKDALLQTVEIAKGILTITYPRIGKKVVIDTNLYNAEIHADAKDHGYVQKYSDAKSGDKTNGVDKLAEIEKIHESLLDGKWKRHGERDTTGIICEAVSRIKKIPLEKVLAAVAGKPDLAKEWGTNGKVKLEILMIKAEKARKAVEAESEELNVNI